MNHLTVDEMLEFVSMTQWDADAVKLAASVNGHIARCEACLRQVRAFQLLHDEFCRMNSQKDFKQYLIAQKNLRKEPPEQETNAFR